MLAPDENNLRRHDSLLTAPGHSSPRSYGIISEAAFDIDILSQALLRLFAHAITSGKSSSDAASGVAIALNKIRIAPPVITKH